MTFLIIGGTGANGSNLVKELVRQGEHPVIYDIYPRKELVGEAANSVKIIKGDVLDFNQLLDTVRKEGVDCIVHLAWLWSGGSAGLLRSQAGLVAEDPCAAFKVNLVGTFNVLEAARILDVKKLVFSSSCQVWRNKAKAMTEDRPKTPSRIYASGKIAIETWGEAYSTSYGLDFVALRFPAGLYGPGRLITRAGGWQLDQMIANTVFGKPTQIADNTKQQRLYLKDLANALVLAAKSEKPKHKVFNIGSDDYYSIGEVSELLKTLIPSADIEIVPQKTSFGSSDEVGWGLDYTRAREELGYKPQYTMESGIKDYMDWIRLNPSLCPVD